MASRGLWAAGAVLALAGAAGVGVGLTRKPEDRSAAALERAKLLVDSEIKERRAQVTTRAESTAVQPSLKAAIGSDANTLADMLAHRDLALPVPDEGEVLELGQIFEGKVTVLLRRPESAPRPAFVQALTVDDVPAAGKEVLTLGDSPSLSRLVRVVSTSPGVSEQGVVGYLVATRRLDFAAAGEQLAAMGVAAQLSFEGKELPLGRAPKAGAPTATAAIATAPSMTVAVQSAGQGGAPMAVIAGGGAAAGVGLLLVLVGLVVRGKERQPSSPRPGSTGLAAGTPSPLGLGMTPSPTGAVTVISGPSPSGSLHLQGGAVIGRWELLRRLGAGGMADVHLARSRGEAGFEKLVALKVMHPFLARNARAVEHFLDEARVAAQIVHPNVVQIYDLGKIGDDYVIVMEYVDGAALDSLMTSMRAAGRKVPIAVALGIMRRICDGLTAAHRAIAKDGTPLSIVHRDVKCGNVLVSKQGVVKVVDFGIAKAAQQSHVTQVGETKGTPSMMAPEQRVGDVVDARADVYSAAAVAYELLTGAAVNLDLAALAHLGTEGWPHLPSPSQVRPELPAELDAIVIGAMAFERERRPADCAAFEAQLEAVAKARGLECSDKELARWVQSELGAVAPAARPAEDGARTW